MKTIFRDRIKACLSGTQCRVSSAAAPPGVLKYSGFPVFKIIFSEPLSGVFLAGLMLRSTNMMQTDICIENILSDGEDFFFDLSRAQFE